jgi:hypothetical protein
MLSRIRKLINKDCQGFGYTVKESVNMYNRSRELSQSFGQIMDDSILKYKKSDTVFILGSGPSINRLDDSFFQKVREHDSIGFNFWFAHKFVPSIYMFQIAIDWSYEPMVNIFYDRSQNYKDVPFLFRGSGVAKGKIDFQDKRLEPLLQKEVYFLNEYPIHSGCSIDIDLLIEHARILGMMDFGRIGTLVPKWRGTLGLIVSLCYQMGYKKIVLCGMDMQDNKHFWDFPEYADIQEKYGLYDMSTGITNMTCKDYSANTVPDYIYKLKDWMFKQNGVELYVANQQTILYPAIPVYPGDGD